MGVIFKAQEPYCPYDIINGRHIHITHMYAIGNGHHFHIASFLCLLAIGVIFKDRWPYYSTLTLLEMGVIFKAQEPYCPYILLMGVIFI